MWKEMVALSLQVWAGARGGWVWLSTPRPPALPWRGFSLGAIWVCGQGWGRDRAQELLTLPSACSEYLMMLMPPSPEEEK